LDLGHPVRARRRDAAPVPGQPGDELELWRRWYPLDELMARSGPSQCKPMRQYPDAANAAGDA